LKNIPLKPGMVFTVEPGLYFDENDKRLPTRYRGIGVRIEDDIVVTAQGAEVITSGVPKTIEAIEKLMAAIPVA
jgi:Xaa-Pro aminopeptidase